MSKIIISIICLLSLANITLAQFSEAGKWAIEAYSTYGFIESNITYKKVGEIELKLDVYRPKTKNPKPLPTLIFFHGGGWRAGTKESYSLRVLPWLEKGWNIVNVEYRVTSQERAPAAVEDCRCALRWVIENAEKYSFDKEKIVVSGQSAGGHLALMTGMAAKETAFDTNCKGVETKVAAIVNWFGITDVGDLLQGKNKTEFASNWIGAERFNQTDLIKLVSPLTYVHEGLPPIITIHGDADPLVPYSHAIRLHNGLTKAKAPNQLFTVKKGDHGDFSIKDSIEAYKAIFKFLKKHGIE